MLENLEVVILFFFFYFRNQFSDFTQYIYFNSSIQIWALCVFVFRVLLLRSGSLPALFVAKTDVAVSVFRAGLSEQDFNFEGWELMYNLEPSSNTHVQLPEYWQEGKTFQTSHAVVL